MVNGEGFEKVADLTSPKCLVSPFCLNTWPGCCRKSGVAGINQKMRSLWLMTEYNYLCKVLRHFGDPSCKLTHQVTVSGRINAMTVEVVSFLFQTVISRLSIKELIKSKCLFTDCLRGGLNFNLELIYSFCIAHETNEFCYKWRILVSQEIWSMILVWPNLPNTTHLTVIFSLSIEFAFQFESILSCHSFCHPSFTQIKVSCID